jgi:DNA-binding NtrC family response regulator
MEVLFLDDDDDLRDAMTDVLALLGHHCVALASYAQLTDLGDGAASFQVAMLDINLGPGVPSGVDAFRWLRDRRFQGQIFFLTGHGRSHPMVLEATRLGEARVVQKPMTFEQLAALLADSGSAGAH